MTNTYIFKKAIEKAVEQGFQNESGNAYVGRLISPRTDKYEDGSTPDDNFISGLCSISIYDDSEKDVRKIFVLDQINDWPYVIYAPSFAKAFFGEEWQKHLQEIVVEEDPIRYLEKFL